MILIVPDAGPLDYTLRIGKTPKVGKPKAATLSSFRLKKADVGWIVSSEGK